MTEAIRDIVRILSGSWPAQWGVLLLADSDAPVPGHPLERQLSGLLKGSACSFPYPAANGVTVWVTMAPDAESLYGAIEDLRAWVLPSYGWEDGLKTSAMASETLGALILALSPAGYFRWKTRTSDDEVVLGKLAVRSRLEERRPTHAVTVVPSLVELRQRFEVALLAGDRESAGGVVAAIDFHGLDTAANTSFMRVRLHDRFCEYDYVIDERAIRDLVTLRMPHSVRVCIAKAFHGHFIASLEATGGPAAIPPVFAEKIFPLLGGVLSRCSPNDGAEVQQLLAYRAALVRDPVGAAGVLAASDDPTLEALLRDLVPTQDAEATVATRPEAAVAATEAAPDEEVRTWDEFVEATHDRRWAAAVAFLGADERPSATTLSTEALPALLDSLEGLFTDPALEHTREVRQVLLGALLQVVGDIRLERDFPRNDYGEIYLRLHQLWVHLKKGSTHREDIALFLVLADAALALPRAETIVVDGISQWWSARRGHSLLSFLLEALGQASNYSEVVEACANLWVDGAGVALRDAGELTRGERLAWRQLGLRLGVDAASVDEFLGQSGLDTGEPDPLAEAGLSRVAIVSFREKQAIEAASQIRKRSGADVMVVGEKNSGTMLVGARTADIILVVWAAISHEVYRAFDDARERVAYVQGTGAESILLSLERELLKRASRGAH